MLPDKLNRYRNNIPQNRNDKEFLNLMKDWINNGISHEEINNTSFLTQEESMKALDNMGVDKNSSFYEYYTDGFDIPQNYHGDELLGLQEIVDRYNDPSFWWDDVDEDIKEKYPDVKTRYIQFSNEEGGGSYFYDKKTDKVYDVTWGEEEAMITGKLKPMFDSFYDFLEWYYDEDNT